MLFPGLTYIVRGPWHFGNFRNIFQPNIGKDQKKKSYIWARGPGTVPYDKFRSSYSITFIKRLDENLK